MKRTLKPVVDHGEHIATLEFDGILPVVVLKTATGEMGVCLVEGMDPAVQRDILEFALSAILTSLEKLSHAEHRQ